MTLILELPDNKEAALKAKALAQGVSAEQFAVQVIDRALEEPASTTDADQRPIWETIAEIVRDVPDQVFDRLPRDAASQVDHYIYGLLDADNASRRAD